MGYRETGGGPVTYAMSQAAGRRRPGIAPVAPPSGAKGGPPSPIARPRCRGAPLCRTPSLHPPGPSASRGPTRKGGSPAAAAGAVRTPSGTPLDASPGAGRDCASAPECATASSRSGVRWSSERLGSPPYIRWNRETLDRSGAGTSRNPPYESHHLNQVDPSNALEFRTGRADTVGRFCNCTRSNPA